MATQGSQEPKYLYSTPAEQPYWDESTSTLDAGAVSDPSKTAANYGTENPKVFGPKESGGNGGTTP